MKYGKNKHSIIGDFILFFNFYVNKLLTNFPRFYTCLFACPCNISVDIEPGFIKKDALFFPCLIKKGHMGACADRTRLFMVLACDTSLLTIVLSQIKLVFIAFFFFCLIQSLSSVTKRKKASTENRTSVCENIFLLITASLR